MNETPHAFAIGDDVISVGCIVAPPTEPHGVRLEIPLACRGTVVDVRPYDYPKPYVVDFEVPEAGGVVVEVEVTGDQIAKVASPDKPDAEQLERLVRTPPHKLRALLHEPSTSHPHHSCRFWHTVHKLLFLSCGVLALMRNPVTVLMVAGLLLVLMYGHHFALHGRLAWRPDVLQPDVPDDGERLEVNTALVQNAWVADLILAALLFAVAIHNFVNLGRQTPESAVVSIVLAASSLVSFLVYLSVHERAVRVVPDI
jgi:hypothetical protein